MHAAATTPPRPRKLVHPGPPDPVRIRSQCSPRGRHVRLALQPGLSLFDALVQPLAALGIQHASATLLGGSFAQLHYCIATTDPTGAAVAAYSAPVTAGHSLLVSGQATLGQGLDGAPLVHCHASFRDADGALRGGHLVPATCRIGERPITVLVTAWEGFALRVAFDAETNIPLLQPFAEDADDQHRHG